MRVWMGTILATLLLMGCAVAESLSVQASGTLHPFETAQIVVEVPASGVLTVGVTDGYGEQQPVVSNLAVNPGQVTLRSPILLRDAPDVRQCHANRAAVDGGWRISGGNNRRAHRWRGGGVGICPPQE